MGPGRPVIADALHQGIIHLSELSAPMAVCTQKGELLGATPTGLSLLASCGAETRNLPQPLPTAMWSAVTEGTKGPAVWHGQHGRRLGYNWHPLGEDRLLLTMQEISHRQQTLTRRLHQQRLETVGHLMATIAHDIRTPLSALVLEVESAWERRTMLDNEDIDQMLRSVRVAASRLTTTIDSLLDYARVGRVDVDPVDIPNILERIHGLLRPLFRERGHQLVMRMNPQVPRVRANALILEQALVNLVVNAAEASDEPLRVEITVEAFDRRPEGAMEPEGRVALPEGVRIMVRDDGPGIPEDDRGRIFDPFYSTKNGGTGLGVPMAREAILACGGDLRLCCDTLDGAAFCIWLPHMEATA